MSMDQFHELCCFAATLVNLFSVVEIATLLLLLPAIPLPLLLLLLLNSNTTT